MTRIRTAAVGGLVEDNPLAAAAVTLNSAGLSALPLFGASDFAVIMFDPNGRTGEPFAKRITAHGTNATSATIDAAAIYGTAREIKQGVPWRLTDIMDQDGNGSGLIALKEHIAGSASTYQTTSTTYVDMDATNMAFSFVGPPSGLVLVRIGVMAYSSVNNYVYINLRDAGGNLANTGSAVAYGGAPAKVSYAKRVSVIPGTNYNWKVGFRTDAGTMYVENSPERVQTMEVWAVNV